MFKFENNMKQNSSKKLCVSTIKHVKVFSVKNVQKQPLVAIEVSLEVVAVVVVAVTVAMNEDMA